MKNSSTTLDRKMIRKRHKMTIGYLAFYALVLALVSMGISFLLGGTAGTSTVPIPKFLYNSVLGMLYIYNAVALVFQWLFAFLLPGPYQFKGLADNSWNMLYKLNVNPRGLTLNKIRVCIFSSLATYLIGFLVATGIGFLKSADKTMDIKSTIFMALIGIFALLLVTTPTLAVGALTKGKALLRLTIFATGGIVAFLMYSCDYYNCSTMDDVVVSASKLISLNPLGLVILPVLFVIIFPIVTLSIAVSRARNYNIEELDDDLLKSLGVEENMLVLEEGRNRYNVAISGPDINDADFDIEVPSMENVGDMRQPRQDERVEIQPKKEKREKKIKERKHKKSHREDDYDDY